MLIDLPIFLGPVVVIVMWLKIANWRDKRSARRGSPEGGRGRAMAGLDRALVAVLRSPYLPNLGAT